MMVHMPAVARGFGMKHFPALCLALLLLGGCGNKAFPRMMTGAPPPQIKDLQAQVRSKAVELSWSVPEGLKDASKGKEPAYVFVILKTEPKWENRNCLDCPTPTEEEVAVINPSLPEPAKVEGNRLVWTDRSVSSQRVYRYKIAIHDQKKRTISASNAALAKVVPPPGPLKNLMAVTQTKGILLQWKAPTRDDQGAALQGDLFFLVERRTQEGAWEKVSSVHLRGNSFLDTAVASNQSYSYRVTPYVIFEDTSVLGETATSQQVQAPQALPPPPPSRVWVIPSKGALEVHWIESEGKAGGYHVYRKEGKEIIRLTGSPIQKAPYLDRAVKRNVAYEYAVSAVGTQPDQQEGLLSKWSETRSLMFE
jgi:hypothetical protein